MRPAASGLLDDAEHTADDRTEDDASNDKVRQHEEDECPYRVIHVPELFDKHIEFVHSNLQVMIVRIEHWSHIYAKDIERQNKKKGACPRPLCVIDCPISLGLYR